VALAAAYRRRAAPPPPPGSTEAAAEPLDPGKAPLAALRVVADLAGAFRPFALGKTGLMRALRGTPDAPIKNDRTGAFGALAAMKKADVERLIEALIERGYLRRDDEDEYRRLYLTGEGRDAVATGEATSSGGCPRRRRPRPR
jgi:hypothetical protein